MSDSRELVLVGFLSLAGRRVIELRANGKHKAPRSAVRDKQAKQERPKIWRRPATLCHCGCRPSRLVARAAAGNARVIGV